MLLDAGDGPATGYAAALSKAYDAASTIELGLGRTDTIENPIAGVLIYCGGMSIAVGDNLDAAVYAVCQAPKKRSYTKRAAGGASSKRRTTGQKAALARAPRGKRPGCS